MRHSVIVGVMGAGARASARDEAAALELGRFIASRGWVLLSGGRDAGVMAAASEGAFGAGGLTIGILPGATGEECCDCVLLPIVTDMGNARNNINVLSSDIVLAIAFHLGAGTAAEIALALKAKRPVVLLTDEKSTGDFFKKLSKNGLFLVEDTAHAQAILARLVSERFPNAYPLKIEGYESVPHHPGSE